MKGNRVVIPTSMTPATLNRLDDAHQVLTSMLQRARRTVYWPKLQDDIRDMVHKCDECQRHATRSPDLQRDRSRQHVQWKSCALIWLTFEVNMP